jgi:multidrug resistance protein MdtO
MIVIYLVTQEDTAATLIGSILGMVGYTVGMGSALLVLTFSMDIPWLRFCFFAVFLFVGLFLKRVLRLGALGSAIGLPGSLVLILPDILPPHPEVLVEFVLWIWLCAMLGLAVNVCVQLLLSPEDPLILLRRELDTRLLAVEQALRRLAGDVAMEPPAASLDSLAIAGMSRPLALLKTASAIHRWAGERNEELAAIITLIDRLVTSALALEALAPLPDGEIRHERLLKAADGCELMRHAFGKLRVPSPGEWTPLAAGQTSGAMSPLTDMERTLDEIALIVPRRSRDIDQSDYVPGPKPYQVVPDAFDNPEHVHFAVKGSLAALICYVLFIGFDYRGIYTSVITCFVLSLSTIGASNQKGLLRFGGAAVGGGMGLIALMYLFPVVETIGGFWLVFGAGTAVAAWVNFGTPRISYCGYQVGLAFYKSILQDQGPPLSAKVIRDRLVGVFFGLVVFSIVEHFLWPVHAADALRARLAKMIHSLADLVRAAAGSSTPTVAGSDVDSWRRRISQIVEDIQRLIESTKFEQGLIESSKFELVALKLGDVQKITSDAQVIFMQLLSLARLGRDFTQPETVRAAAPDLNNAIATALLALEARIAGGSEPEVPNLEAVMDAFERSVTAVTNVTDEKAADPHLSEYLALYRALVSAVKRLSSEPLNAGPKGLEVRVLAVQSE